MKGGKSAHRQADDMRLVDLERIEHRTDVIPRALLRVALALLRHIGGWIAARIEGHATVILRKMTNLLFIRAVVAGKFMNKNDWDAFSGFFVIELDSIVCPEMWHEFPV